MRELKILYRKEWLIYLTYVLVGIGTPIVMTLLMMTGNSEDFSGSFNGVYNNTLLLSGIGTMLHLEHENCQLEVGCFVVNRKRYMKFRILQMIARAIVLSMALILATKLWRVLIPGGGTILRHFLCRKRYRMLYCLWFDINFDKFRFIAGFRQKETIIFNDCG